MSKVEIRRAPLDRYRAAPGQLLNTWVYSYRIDDGEWSMWDRGLRWVREQAARLAGIPQKDVRELWKVDE